MPPLTSSSADTAAPALVKDVTAQNFMQEVVQPSLQMPVLVYFTAAWCGPCKQFGPMLEKAVNEAKGRVKLARVDIDKSPELAQQFRIQSVPMVYIFYQGQPLDGFAGALPESQIKQLIAQLPGGEAENQAAQATLEVAGTLLQEGKHAEAEQAYKEILAADENNPEAVAGLARAFIAQGEAEKAEGLLSQLSDELKKHEAITGAQAALMLALAAPTGVNEALLRENIESNPLDHLSRYDLAAILFAAGKQEDAIEELLAIIPRSRDWNENAARTRLLSFFEAIGHAHPLAVRGRRKLSSILFS